MAKSTVASRIILAVAAALSLGVPPVRAQADGRPNFYRAQAAFDRLPVRDRNEAFLELMATGDFNAMASSRFGGRLYDATASFQAAHGLDPSGVLTAETRSALSDVGGRIFNSWGMEFLDHPTAAASLAIPGRFGLVSSPTQHGFNLDNRSRSMSINFAFFPDGEAGLETIFDRLTAPAPGRRIDFKLIRPTFFAIAGGSDTTGNYSRYIVVPGGIVGFTAAWNVRALPNGNRVANVMANELYPRHMVSEGQQADMFSAFPADVEPDAPRFADGGQTPTNAGSDAVSQAALEARLEAERRARDAEFERQMALAAQQRAATEARIRLAQQAEADRQARADAEKVAQRVEAERKARIERDARDAAAAELKAERLAQDVAAARLVIREASDFVKAAPDDPRLVDHLGSINELGGALSSTEPDVVERKTASLAQALAADPAYPAFDAQWVADRARQNARDLAQAMVALRKQKAFLIDDVAKDATSSRAGAFLVLVKQIDTELSDTDADRARTVVGTVDRALTDAGLRNAYAARSAEIDRAAAPAASSPVAASPPVAASLAGRDDAQTVPASTTGTGTTVDGPSGGDNGPILQ